MKNNYCCREKTFLGRLGMFTEGICIYFCIVIGMLFYLVFGLVYLTYVPFKWLFTGKV